MRALDVIDCHVLVIGSGGAGVRAAIEADQYGETVLLSKSLTGKGGCTTMAEGGYNAVLKDDDTCDLHVGDTLRGGAYLNDPALVEALVHDAPARLTDLVRWGAVFDASADREVAQRSFGGQSFPRTCYAGDRTGHEIMATLMERLRGSGVERLEETAAIELLRDGDRVCGALALNRKGELIAVRADATVLAAGGGSRVYDVSTNSGTGTGDGFALGYRAGADLIDMEMVQFHPTGAVYPYDARGRLVTEAVRGEGGHLVNAEGERFMHRYDPERMELSTRDVVARAIATEVLEGRGTSHDGVWLDVTHLPAGQIEERLPLMLSQFLRYGVDIRTEAMEVAPTAHHVMGGLRITPACQTSLAGLFACGETAGGVHGANRLGGNALAETQVFGKRAGEAAGKTPERAKVLDKVQVAAQEERLAAFYEGESSPTWAREHLQRAMWDGAGIRRDATALQTTQRVVEGLLAAPLKAVSERNLIECCGARNLCTTALLIVRSALLRPESRGAHYRTDVPPGPDPAHSPYGHTRISLHGASIEERKA
ncbi:fumarate reductase subunit A [Methanofollis aquaemaris]|uniref:Fumarate reductase subunit A n=1 Tax=Methanofollis aquaemaris TaxID=126734 RepID=A0A8A3S5R0_9EURY|nr:fumarate reductase (CoM/CoB) subunit TfrA [Methanofollis aquaemaris]QSZ67597.1 fumarate reductase subunit A [Methanofollis aquaemaris]